MLKKAIKLTTACSLVVTALLANSPIVLAKTNGNVTVTKDETNKTITIGNHSISRTFSYSNEKLSTSVINNLMAGADKKFTPKEGSEEFVIRYLGDSIKRAEDPKLTSVKPVKDAGSTTSFSSTGEGNVAALYDKNLGTHWQSNHETVTDPAYIEINFGKNTEVKKVVYTPRYSTEHKYNCTGNATKLDLQKWTGSAWESVKISDWSYDATKAQKDQVKDLVLDSAITTTKIRLVAKETYFWQDTNAAKNKVLAAAELDVQDSKGTSVLTKAESGWKMSGNSVSTQEGAGYAGLIDGNLDSHYHSNYGNGEGTPSKLPVELTLDRGENAASAPFQTLGYRPRKEGLNANGNIQNYEIYVSDTKDSLYNANNKVKTGTFSYVDVYTTANNPKYIYIGFDKPQTGRYVGIKVLSSAGGDKFAAGTEIDLFKEKHDSIANPDAAKPVELKASELKFKSVTEEATTAKINGKDKTGKMLTFAFEPKTVGKNTVTINQKVVMYDGDHFMRKFLEIKNSDDEARIDYIDGEHLVVDANDSKWSIPHAGGIVAMEQFKANLGQPIYVNGMFLGSEFPATRTEFEGNVGMIRYYTGKNFKDFTRDHQLTEDGKYVSWQTVLGASPVSNFEGNNLDIVKQSFFNYIDSIATPSEFRIQYNSWFDNMMKIDDENILNSFIEIDKEFSKTGVRPLDSYVVDDGWTNYNDTRVLDPLRSGTTLNETGFWEFNSKFPKELTPSSQLVQNFGSNFGVWIGPRGGYNFYSDLANILVKHKTGSKAGGSIDVADSVYVKKFEEMAIKWMRDFKVNYWKWDGFADGSQYGHFPSGEGVVGYSESNRHMYGGVHHMYHVTDLWEKWIGLMKNVRKAEKELGINKLWISLTCYVNPSPWFLQWANSVWIQCVADRGERHNGVIDDKMNAMLTYRDGVYYDFTVRHQYQFPLQNIYNHDPIYGQEDTGIKKDSMDGEQFRNYMFMQGTRGTAFWELYYSDALFNDEKYLINADFLEWAEGNFDKLKNAIMIGKNPSTTATLTGPVGHSGQSAASGDQDAYGFACFDKTGENAIISMRNPAAKEKTIEFKLDDAIGAKAKGVTFNVSTVSKYVHKNTVSKAKIADTYTQGDTVQVTLQPGETYVLNFNKAEDKTAPTVSKLFTNASDKLQVQTSEHVSNADFTVKVNDKEVEFTKEDVADLRTFNLTLKTAMKNGDKVEVIAKAGKDSANNTLTGSKSMYYYNKGLLVSKAEVKKDIAVSGLQNSVVGENGFSVSTVVNTKATNKVLLSQGKDWALGIDADGKAYFTVNGVTVTSKEAVNTGNEVSITAVKENNGILKLYINGKINASAYDAKNKDFKVSPAIIQAKAKDVVLNNVKVYNRALGYDELPKTTEAKVENLALHKVPTASWLNSNVTEDVLDQGSPLTNATDGVSSQVDKYAIFGKDAKKEPSYMQIDLGDVYDVNNVKLYRYWQDNRKYDATALVVSEDENFTNKKVLFYSSDDKTKDVFKLGENPKHDLYNESSDGKDLYKGDFVKARYVRLYAYGRADETGANNNHVNEIQVFGKKDVTDPDTDIPATPLEPGTPVDKPNVPLTPIGPSTPVGKPDVPLTPLEPSKPVEKPNTGGGTTIKPVDPKPENKPNKDETGTGDVTNFASVVSVAGVAALGVYLSAKARKDEE